MSKRLQYIVVTVSTCLLLILLLGTVLGRTSAADENAYRHFSVFAEVMAKIKGEYVEEPDMKSVALGALNGLLESLDPYASFLSADQYKQYLKAQENKKAGVGLILSRRFGYVSVVDSIPGSPADTLNIQTGDILEAINGVSSRDMPLAYAEMLLLGDPGTTLEINLIRVRKSAEAVKVQLTRQNFPTPAVTSKMMPGEVGYLRIPGFDKGKSKEIAAKVAELQRQGAKRLVLDVRNSALGPVEEGIEAANLFVGKGQITSLVGQKVARQNFEADPAKQIYKDPVVVITNRGTAGGGELMAAAILDNKRGEVVGERSYGEAALRKALTLEDGSAVVLAVAKYHTPAGKAIPDHAVVPSLLVVDPDPPGDLDDETPPQPNAPVKQEEDLQLKRAIEVVTLGIEAAKKAAKEMALKPSSDGPKPPSETILTPLGAPKRPER